MNILWTFLIVSSIVFFLFTNPNLILTTSIDSIYQSLKLCFTLAGIYIFWLGIMRVMQESGLSNVIAKLLKPIIWLLFGNIDKETSELIALNFSANLLGLGNASLPAGVKAMGKLQNGIKKDVNTNMIMLFALNCCSIQLLPSSVILIRADAGSNASGDIILPIWIVSFVCVTLTIFLVKIIFKGK